MQGMEPYSEFFTAQAAQAFGTDHVPYALEERKGKLASVCPLMHKLSTAFVPFWTAVPSRFFRTLRQPHRPAGTVKILSHFTTTP